MWAAPKAQWRTRLVALKFRGALPFLTWKDVGREMLPNRMIDVHQIGMAGLLRVISGPVRFRASGEAPCPVLWQTPMGEFWGRAQDGPLLDFLMKEQLVDSVYQRGPVVIRKDDVVLDGGAHLGVFTRLALDHGARIIVGFEPEPTNIACFKRTFQKEIAEGRVILEEAALWETTGSLRFQVNGFNSAAGSAIFAVDVVREIDVRSTTIDETVRKLNLPQVDFIKMDIEGSERYALKGGRRTIARFGPRMALCIYHRPDDPTILRQLVIEARPAYQVFTTATQAYFY